MIFSLKKHLKCTAEYLYMDVTQKDLSEISILMLFSSPKQSVNWEQLYILLSVRNAVNLLVIDFFFIPLLIHLVNGMEQWGLV